MTHFKRGIVCSELPIFLFLKVTGKKARIGSFSHSGHALFFIDKAIDGIPVIKLQRIVLSPLENYCVVDET